MRRLTAPTTMAAAKWISSNSSLSFNHPEYELFNHLIEACKSSSNLKSATITHARVIRLGYGTHPSLAASLILTYVKSDHFNLACLLINQVFSWTVNLTSLNSVIDILMRAGEYEIAHKVFDKMPDLDVITWNSMIGGYVKNARFEEALRFFRVMLRENVEPDKFTFASVITACARLGAVDNARWVHELMVRKGIELNSILSSALIDMYSKCGRIEFAKGIFNSVMRGDVSVWNSMINGLAVHGLALDAISVFLRMEVENVVPDCITFLGVLTACSHCGLIEEGRKYFDLMKRSSSIRPELEHYGAMVDLLSRAGLLEEAYAVIKGMPMEPDVVIWRALLSGSRTFKMPGLGEVAIANISRRKSGDYVLLSNMYCSQERWDSAQGVREMMQRNKVRKVQGKSWFECDGVVHHFKSGDRSHPETESVYKILEGLIQRTKMEGFVHTTELVTMDVSEEEKERNLHYHSEKLALAYAIFKTSPGTEIMISKNLRICNDCHNWIKMVSEILSRVIIVRDRIRFHRFEGGSCSCGDYW
ncbi:pentatricopeptide repeat-containing protein At5g50990 [Mercurialis annua]|uniref:pentatricopeptide repeat-containing protein At5g50990 n=1 Tax=Mercurialis annua TaxID=3986 RepID=UPI00215F0F84|nr:pentatricopeptide repeat-containing protein At5g50990 [Mercurialis annua]XP_050226120.1 pentatricopeptide repeat-containing protein At5g50990 [Mercurialis annua]